MLMPCDPDGSSNGRNGADALHPCGPDFAFHAYCAETPIFDDGLPSALLRDDLKRAVPLRPPARIAVGADGFHAHVSGILMLH
jgi:hypothetical protein